MMLAVPLCVLGLSVMAQVDDDDMRAFVAVYLAEKDIVLPCDTMIRSWLNELALPEHRYGEILKAEIKGSDPGLTESERTARHELQARSNACEQEHRSKVRQLCADHELDDARYTSMLQEYQTRVAFQQVLRPYFREEIQRSNEK
jgi:hypothetical protein